MAMSSTNTPFMTPSVSQKIQFVYLHKIQCVIKYLEMEYYLFVMKVTPDLHLAYSNQRTIGPINISLVPGKRIFKGVLPYTGIIPIAAILVT